MTNRNSMRYRPEELLRGLLASVSCERFTGASDVLGGTLDQLAEKLSIFQQFASNGNGKPLSDTASAALKALEGQGVLTHEASSGAYHLNHEGRAHCKSSKQTLFSKADIAQLEEGATLFDQKCGVKG